MVWACLLQASERRDGDELGAAWRDHHQASWLERDDVAQRVEDVAQHAAAAIQQAVASGSERRWQRTR